MLCSDAVQVFGCMLFHLLHALSKPLSGEQHVSHVGLPGSRLWCTAALLVPGMMVSAYVTWGVLLSRQSVCCGHAPLTSCLCQRLS